MKRILLFLMLTLCLAMSSSAAELTISLKNRFTVSGYQSGTFNEGNLTFYAGNMMPSGQIRANQGTENSANASNFYFYNQTAIPNISKLEIVFGSSNGVNQTEAQSFRLRVGNSAITTSALGTIKGNLSGTSVVLEPTDVSQSFFRIDLAKIGGTRIPESIKITYGSTKKSAGLSFSSDKKTVTLGETPYDLPTLSYNTTATIKYSSSNQNVAEILPNGNISIIAGGSTIIKATSEENNEYMAGEAAYTLTVIDPNDIYTEISTEFFKKTTSNYEAKVQSDAYVTYSSVLSSNNGNMQYNTSNDNGGKASGLVVSKINSDYLISYIDIETGSKASLNVYKSSSAFPELVAGVTPTNTGTQVNDDAITSSQTITIDDYAFAIFPSNNNSMGVVKVTVHYQKINGSKLGDLTYAVTGEKQIEDEAITVDINDVFTFWAENATNIIVKVDDEDVNGKFENGTYTWTVNKGYEDAIVEVIPYMNSTPGESFIFSVTAKPKMPVVKIGEETLNSEESQIVAPGTVLTISCEGAIYVEGYYNEEEIKFDTLPNQYIINESGDLMISGLNNNVEGETFFYTFIVGDVDPNQPGVGSTFKQVLYSTYEKELEADKYYVIARHYTTGNNHVSAAISTTFNNGNFHATNVEFEAYEQKYYNGSNAYPTRTLDLLTSTEDVLIFKLEKQGDSWGLKTVNYGDGFTSSQKYLTNGISDTSLALSEEFASVSIDFRSSNNVIIKFPETSQDRQLKYNDNGTFNNVKSTTANLQLYKYTAGKRFNPNLEDFTLKVGDTKTIEFEEETPENIVYRVKGNTRCIEITDNKITATDIREADKPIVTAEWLDTDEWLGNVAEFTVTVRYPAELNFRYAEVRGKIDVGVTAQAAYYTGDGTLNYSVWEYADPNSDEKTLVETKDIRINPETGMIRPEDIKADGEINGAVVDKIYTVKAHVEGDKGSFVEDDAYYTIVFEAPETGEPVSAFGTFDFTKLEENGDRAYHMFPFNEDSKNNYEEDLLVDGRNQKVQYFETTISKWSDGSYEDYEPVVSITSKDNPALKIDFGGQYRSWQNNGAYHLRLYANGEMKISTSEGTITKLEFSSGSGLNKLAVKDGKGTYKSDSNGRSADWVAPTSEGVEEVTIYYKNTNDKTEIPTIKVTLNVPSSDAADAQLSFNDEDRVYNMYAGDRSLMPSLNYNKVVISFDEIDFSIDPITNFDGTTQPVEYDKEIEGENVFITVTEPGVYTFRATPKEGTEVLNGMAILRLNVFPRLSVLPEDDSKLAEGEGDGDQRSHNNPELTIAHPDNQTTADGELKTTIKLPTLDELNNAFKYSTMSIDMITIAHGDKKTVYSMVPVEDEEDGVEYKDMSELDTTAEFVEDGSISYRMVYANTPDFFMEEKVHVVIMPQMPVDSEIMDNKVTLTPSKNASLRYAFDTDLKNKSNSKRMANKADINAEDYNWTDAISNEVEIPEGASKLYFMSVKDLDAIIANNEKTYGELNSEIGEITLEPIPVTLNLGKIQAQPFDVNSDTYSLESGLIQFDQALTYGTDFTVTVTRDENDEWVAPENAEDLDSSYKTAFGVDEGLYNQYKALDAKYVDGFFTGVGKVTVEPSDKPGKSFDVSVILPCSGQYVVTVAPVAGSAYTFNAETATFDVYPNLTATFGSKERGFNIEGYMLKESQGNGGGYEIGFPNNGDFEFTQEMVCYIPGTYFASEFTVTAEYEGGSQPQLVKRAENGAAATGKYYDKVDLTALNKVASQKVTVNVTKNGASQKYEFVVNKTEDTPNQSTGVAGIEEDDAEVEYFTVDGIKVTNPEHGIYIVKKGNKTMKVLL